MFGDMDCKLWFQRRFVACVCVCVCVRSLPVGKCQKGRHAFWQIGRIPKAFPTRNSSTKSSLHVWPSVFLMKIGQKNVVVIGDFMFLETSLAWHIFCVRGRCSQQDLRWHIFWWYAGIPHVYQTGHTAVRLKVPRKIWINSGLGADSSIVLCLIWIHFPHFKEQWRIYKNINVRKRFRSNWSDRL